MEFSLTKKRYHHTIYKVILSLFEISTSVTEPSPPVSDNFLNICRAEVLSLPKKLIPEELSAYLKFIFSFLRYIFLANDSLPLRGTGTLYLRYYAYLSTSTAPT